MLAKRFGFSFKQLSRWRLILGATLVLAAAIAVLLAVLQNSRLSAEEAKLVGTWAMPAGLFTADLRADHTVVWRKNPKRPGTHKPELGHWRVRASKLELSFPKPITQRFWYLVHRHRWPEREKVRKCSISTDANGSLRFVSDDRSLVGRKLADGITGIGGED